MRGDFSLRTLTLVLAMLAIAIVPATYAAHDSSPVVASSATISKAAPPLADASATSTTLYTHRDCVGPGAPDTNGPHSTHTTSVPGVAAGSVVNFGINGFALTGSPGPCPLTAADLGYLPLDFTGQYHLKAVCQGNINPNTVFVDWTITYVVGVATTSSFGGNVCYAYVGTTFSLDTTIAINPATLPIVGVSVPATGAVQLTVSQ